MSDQPTQVCDNCQKAFPESKIATHFGYCRRNIKKCQTCGEMYDINFTEDHQQQFHKVTPCRHCKKTYKPNQILKHQKSCPSRTQFCEYCELNVPLKDYPAHLKQCQARTKQCQKCRKPITNKQFLIHTISCPGFVQEPKPRIENPVNYNNYNDYIRNVQKKQEIIRNQYKPSYQEPKRQLGSKGVRSMDKKQPVYANIQNPPQNVNYYGKQTKPIQEQRGLNRDFGVNNRQSGSTQNRNIPNNQVQKETNKYGISYGQKRIIPNTVAQKQKTSNLVTSNPGKIDSYKNIDNKYSPGIRSTQNPVINGPSTNSYKHQNQPKIISNSNKVQAPYSYQGKQVQPPSNNYSKPNQQYKKQYPRVNQEFRKDNLKQKDAFTKKQVQKNKYYQPKNSQIPTQGIVRRQADYKERLQGYRAQEINKVQPSRQKQQSRGNVIPPPQYNYVEAPFHGGEHEEDQQMQKAIMESMGISKNKSPNNFSTKPKYKIQDIPPQFLEQDMMNESFYDKQTAIMQEIQRSKKRR